MGFMLRQMPATANFADEFVLEALAAALPPPAIQAIVAVYPRATQRRRKLSAELALLLVVGMNLFTHDPLAQVLAKLLQGWRLIAPDPSAPLATKSAICQARYRLGAAPVVELFHQVCHPMAPPTTPGAFLFGLRLMAIDGTTEDLPDTLENARAFGRPSTGRGEGAFPQVQGVYLIECGTHAIVDAGFWPCHTSERVGGLRLLRSVSEGMLLMWDRGFHSFAMVASTRTRHAHFLGRVPAHVRLTPIKRLSDGSYLASLRPGKKERQWRGHRLLVRVIEYTLTDPSLPGYGTRYRLITSLLDPAQAPAAELAGAYHERWEVEITLDEIDTHQRLVHHPLRSQKPVGVVQELYGLLIAHYAVRRVMLDAARAADLDPDRISFLNAVRLICMAIPEFQQVCPEQLPELYQRLLNDIARHRLPERKPRTNPRVVKRKMSNFGLKRATHRRWPQPSMSFRDAVAILN
jgi:Insertion element 4 transposase N-terminal/Transposase DDE domain